MYNDVFFYNIYIYSPHAAWTWCPISWCYIKLNRAVFESITNSTTVQWPASLEEILYPSSDIIIIIIRCPRKTSGRNNDFRTTTTVVRLYHTHSPVSTSPPRATQSRSIICVERKIEIAETVAKCVLAVRHNPNVQTIEKSCGYFFFLNFQLISSLGQHIYTCSRDFCRFTQPNGTHTYRAVCCRYLNTTYTYTMAARECQCTLSYVLCVIDWNISRSK